MRGVTFTVIRDWERAKTKIHGRCDLWMMTAIHDSHGVLQVALHACGDGGDIGEEEEKGEGEKEG